MKAFLTLLGGIGIGAVWMYLMDPDGGNRRRSLIRDKAVSLNRKTQRAVSGRVQDLSNRAKGMLHESKSVLTDRSRATAEGQQIH